jgi:predicted alpha/beta-fold hydrolase
LGALDVIAALARPEAPDTFAAGGIAVSPPGDLVRMTARLDRGFSYVDSGLSAVFGRTFESYIEQRIARQRIALPEDCLRLVATGPRSFSRLLCAIAAGLPEPLAAEALLERAQPVPRLREVRTPLLLLATSNDPLLTGEAALELAAGAAGNPLVRVIETPYGGHIGQIGLAPRWFAETTIRFFRRSSSAP